MADRHVFGDFFDNDEILWFIILFLLIFWCRPFWGCKGISPIGTC